MHACIGRILHVYAHSRETNPQHGYVPQRELAALAKLKARVVAAVAQLVAHVVALLRVRLVPVCRRVPVLGLDSEILTPQISKHLESIFWRQDEREEGKADEAEGEAKDNSEKRNKRHPGLDLVVPIYITC